ncbi:MAG: hypothetical protein QOF02_3922 [Blastocatellia bacterium]|jgi:uncharacterized membrane protein (DUF373 family)|nr:hypothetical protein [Blastocatellia bacterium]
MGESREQTESGTGEVTVAEQALNRYVGNAIHMFLSVLAVLLLVAAAIMTFEMLIRDFPKLWQPVDEYKALQLIVSDILLIAIAAELGLLLLYHRTSAAVEVIIFVIARKTVSPDTSALELLMSVAALVALLVARFYFLPGKPK